MNITPRRETSRSPSSAPKSSARRPRPNPYSGLAKLDHDFRVDFG